jgi:hypothetical protein
MRRRCSAAGMSSARRIAVAIDSVSYALTVSASCSSSTAPANSLSTRTPPPSTRDAANSFATRFMPSRSGVTTMTSAARYSATSCSGVTD